jgi:hypothetical protein
MDSNDQNETQALLVSTHASSTSTTQQDSSPSDPHNNSSIIQANNSPAPSGRDLWDYFETTRRSAKFHLNEYLRYRQYGTNLHSISQQESEDIGKCQLDEEPPAVGSLEVILGILTCPVAQHNESRERSFWRFKVARDSLLKDLETLLELLDTMHTTSQKGLAKLYVLILFL